MANQNGSSTRERKEARIATNIELASYLAMGMRGGGNSLSSNKQSLSTYWMPGTVLGSECTP